MGLNHARSRVANEQLEAAEDLVDYISDQLDLVDFAKLGQITDEMRENPSLYFALLERLYEDLKSGCDGIRRAKTGSGDVELSGVGLTSESQEDIDNEKVE